MACAKRGKRRGRMACAKREKKRDVERLMPKEKEVLRGVEWLTPKEKEQASSRAIVVESLKNEWA
jgi:hypothetical protein